MKGRRYIWDRQARDWVPYEQYRRPLQAMHNVIPDIQPYRSTIDGSVISSRSTHRQHLREHGCVEVGNEWNRAESKRTIPDVPGLGQELSRAYDRLAR